MIVKLTLDSLVIRGLAGGVVALVFFGLSFVFEGHWVARVLWVLGFASFVVVPTVLYNLIKDRG